MSNFVLILGESGNGKSSSIKGLNSDETIVCNVLSKRLPFKGSRAMYSKEKKNLFAVSEWTNVIKLLKAIDSSRPDVKNVVIDDSTYILRTEFFNRATEKGFDKFTEIADHFRNIITTASNLRDDLNVFMLMHCEPVEEDGNVVGYKSSTVGKLLDKQYRPEETVTITLFAKPKYDANGKPEFGFWTHKVIDDGVEIPAKTPEGMFDDDFIPNDLGLVVKTMDEYYG